MGVDGQRHAPAALHPGTTRYPVYRRLGGLQGRSGWVRKFSPPPGFDAQTVYPVASCYTDDIHFRDNILGQISRFGPSKTLGLQSTLRWDQDVVPKFQLLITKLRCVTYQKRKGLKYTATETKNIASSHYLKLFLFPIFICIGIGLAKDSLLNLTIYLQGTNSDIQF